MSETTNQLDAFLAQGAQPPAQPAPEQPPRPDGPPSTPPQPPHERPQTPTPKPAPEPGKPSAKPPDAQPELDAEHEKLLASADNGTVPRSALEQVRRDWKSRFAAEQAKAQLLAQQLEEAKRPPPAPQAPPQQFRPQPMPDPRVDPEGWTQKIYEDQQRALVNERLNMSEAFVTERVGADKLREYVQDFKRFAASDPSLWGKLYSQPSPYSWMIPEIDKLRTRSEFEGNPEAYKAKLRAEWEAEREAGTPHAPPPVSPAAGLPPSLASARSVAGRSTSTFTGPPSMDDILRRPQQAARR